MPELIIFDFDGVIADSETLANSVLAEVISELGHPTTLDDSIRLYMGKRAHEVVAAIEARLDRALPVDFAARLQKRTLDRLERELTIIEGAQEYIRTFASIPQCIASSSSLERLELCLRVLGLTDVFKSNVFSASQVKRGKPHPDIFLYAVQQMGIEPTCTIVIEDSVSGVQAGVAAGTTVIGLLAASHISSGHEEQLRSAGAHHVARTFADATNITNSLLTSF